MTIQKYENGSELRIALNGRLDTNSAPLLEAELNKSAGDKRSLIFDFAQVEYISSAGLRVLLSAQKRMNRQGTMLVKNVCAAVMEVFEITGFCDVLNIEQEG